MLAEGLITYISDMEFLTHVHKEHSQCIKNKLRNSPKKMNKGFETLRQRKQMDLKQLSM